MANNTIWIALGSIGISVAAQFALKRGMAGQGGATTADVRSVLALFTNPYVLLGLGLYAVGAVVWLGVLARWDVSKAYPLVGVGFALALVVGFLAGEAVTAQRLAGVVTICLGVWLVSRS